jgi:FkbM family methyltransferase
VIESVIDNLIRLRWRFIYFGRRNSLLGKRTLSRLFGGLREIQSKTKWGIILRLNPSEYVDQMLLKHGEFESEVLEAILGFLREGDTFWDIGSNLGLHALGVKKKMPSITVEAFEPNPLMYSLIVEASNFNHLDIKVLQLGLSNREGDADFFVNTTGNLGGSTLNFTTELPNPRRIQVSLACGDRLVREKECHSPHVIKIDVESHELEACLGMLELLRGGTLRAIIFEDEAPFDTPVKKLLMENGYNVRLLKHHNFIGEKSPKGP